MKENEISRQAVLKVLSDYFGQYRKHPFHAFGAFVLPAIGTIFVFFVPPLIIARIVNILADGGTVTLTSVGGYIALFGSLWLLGEIFWRFGIHFLIKLEALGINDLANQAFSRLMERDYDFYANNFVGTLTKTTLSFSRGFEVFTDTFAFNIITNLFPLIFALVVLGQFSLWLPSLLMICVVVVLVTAIPMIRKRSKLVALRHTASSKVSGGLSDVITNILAVKSFASEKQEGISYGKNVADFVTKFKNASNFQNARIEVLLSPLYVITNVIGLAAAVYFTQSSGLQAGTMVIVFSYFSQVTRVFWDINHVYRNLESSVSEASEFAEFFVKPPTIIDLPGAPDLKLKNAEIRFNEINFRYGSRAERPLFLEKFTLAIPGGQRVGLVGPSGGGKTTITKLLLRFTDVESGSVTVDAQEIDKVSQRSLREIIGYVPQEPLLFHRSLFENIAYSDSKATREDVVRAAKLARADDFIKDLSQGYETLVGERGVKLSGGQRQRVAIARAILKNAPILVLDEATSSLDSESEKYIQEGLWELMKDKTALVIAHRLSTIKHLDRIIVLEQGRIVQDGTHDELVTQDGLYAKLWSHQSGGFLEE